MPNNARMTHSRGTASASDIKISDVPRPRHAVVKPSDLRPLLCARTGIRNPPAYEIPSVRSCRPGTSFTPKKASRAGSSQVFRGGDASRPATESETTISSGGGRGDGGDEARLKKKKVRLLVFLRVLSRNTRDPSQVLFGRSQPPRMEGDGNGRGKLSVFWRRRGGGRIQRELDGDPNPRHRVLGRGGAAVDLGRQGRVRRGVAAWSLSSSMGRAGARAPRRRRRCWAPTSPAATFRVFFAGTEAGAFGNAVGAGFLTLYDASRAEERPPSTGMAGAHTPRRRRQR